MTAASVANWLLAYAVHSTATIVAVLLLTRRVRHPILVDVLWKAALVGPVVTALLATGGLSRGANVAVVAPVVAAPLVLADQSASAQPDAAPDRAGSPPVVVGRARSPLALETLLVGLWAGVAGLLVAGFGLRRWQLARQLGQRRHVADHPIVAELAVLRRDAGFARPVALTASGRLASPIVVGVAEISVPDKALTDLAPEERLGMLAHELAHLVRRDTLWLAAAGLLERVLWFQPGVRLVRRRLQSVAEVLCDRWAADRVGTPITVAACLVKVAEWIDAAPRPVPLVGMAEERSELVDRVRRLVEDAPVEGPIRRGWVIGLAVLGLAGVVAFAPRVSLEGQQRARLDAAGSRPSAQPLGDTGDGREAAEREVEPRQTPDGDRPVDREKDDTTDVVPALITALKDSNGEVRRAAAQSLGAWKDRRATTALVAALDDAETEVRVAATQALGELGDSRAVSGLTARLADPQTEVRRAALHALAEMREVSAEVFRPALADEDADARQAALHALAQRRDRRSAPDVAALVADRDANVRQAALHALAQFEDPSTAPAIIAAITDRDADVRQAALHALGQLELDAVPDAVITALTDSDGDVRQAAAWMVGHAEDARGVPALTRLLSDPDSDVREAAVEALAEIRNDAAMQALVAGLKSTDPVVRRAAAQALGQKER